MNDPMTLVGSDEPRFRHSPYRMLESVQGDTVFLDKHYTDAKVWVVTEEFYAGEDEDGNPVFETLEVERTLVEVAELLSQATGEDYVVVEHTFTNACSKCVDQVPKRGFRGK